MPFYYGSFESFKLSRKRHKEDSITKTECEKFYYPTWDSPLSKIYYMRYMENEEEKEMESNYFNGYKKVDKKGPDSNNTNKFLEESLKGVIDKS